MFVNMTFSWPAHKGIKSGIPGFCEQCILQFLYDEDSVMWEVYASVHVWRY